MKLHTLRYSFDLCTCPCTRSCTFFVVDTHFSGSNFKTKKMPRYFILLLWFKQNRVSNQIQNLLQTRRWFEMIKPFCVCIHFEGQKSCCLLLWFGSHQCLMYKQKSYEANKMWYSYKQLTRQVLLFVCTFGFIINN